MAITNATVVPILYAARLVEQYRRRRVFAERVDRQWQGQLANGGNTVRLNVAAAGTLTDYVIDTALVYSGADVTALGDLTLTKQKYFAVSIDDINAIQAAVGVLDAAVEQDSILLAEAVDADVRAVMDTDATAGPAVALDHSADLTADNFKIPQMHRIMDIAKLPREGRWVIVGPYTAELIMKYSLQNAVLNAPIAGALQNGSIGRFGGLDWFVDSGENSAYVAADNTADEEWFFGNDTATAFIDQIRRVEPIRRETAFADAVRGLYTYGVKVHIPARLFKSAVAIIKIP